MTRRDRRDRDRQTCPRCGKSVTVRRDGGLMAHNGPDRTPCTPPAWKQRAAMDRTPPALCATGCGLAAAPGDRYCHGCGSARDREGWTS